MPFGLNVGELIAALLAVVLLVWVVSYYFSSLRPEQQSLRVLEAQLAEQQKNITAITKPAGPEAPGPADVAKTALESLEAFTANHLKPFSSGRIDLIKEINALAKKNNVSLTSGIDMGASAGESTAEGDKSSEKANQKKGSSSRKKADDLFNAFPTVNFRFTVFGQYSNLRTFINALEREKQFLVIHSINLMSQEARAAGKRARAEGMSGIMVTVDMSAYFRPI
jgi:hypothetical protein